MRFRHTPFMKTVFAVFLVSMMLSSCSNKFCDCLKEEEKERPDQAVLDKCREAFSNMEMDEIKREIDACGK